MEHGVEPVVLGGGEELPQLAHGPDLATGTGVGVDVAHLRRRCPVAGVALHPLPAHGIRERLVKGPVDIANGRRLQRPTSAATSSPQVTVEAVEVVC